MQVDLDWSIDGSLFVLFCLFEFDKCRLDGHKSQSEMVAHTHTHIAKERKIFGQYEIEQLVLLRYILCGYMRYVTIYAPQARAAIKSG